MNQLLPDQYFAERKEMQHKIKLVKRMNKDRPQNEQTKFSIKNNTLSLDGKPQNKLVHTPSVAEILTIDPKEQDHMNSIPKATWDISKEKGSQFMGYAAKIKTVTEARRCIRE